MIVINLFGGPGAGKSTTRSGLFSRMKLAGMSVEEVTEYAKDLTWEGNKTKLQDQFLVSAEQAWRQRRLIGQVEYCVTDSPIILGAIYHKADWLPSLPAVLMEDFGRYTNINILLQRVKPYASAGRGQTEEEAWKLDYAIRGLLLEQRLPFTELLGDENAPDHILNIIKQTNELV